MAPVARRRAVVIVAVGALALGVAACRSGGDAASNATTTPAATSVIDPGDGGAYGPRLDPADFVEEIDHPYLPLTVGSRWVYEGISDGETERIEVVVTSAQREILGIAATVVRDTVHVDGELVEDTFDWFAQDRVGNVWYLGEDSREYEDGELVGTEGSWEAGVDGASAGVVMLAAPAVGDAYRQEFLAGEAEDLAEVLRLDDSITITLGSYDRVLTTREWTPLEPEVIEEKSYARGVGLVLERAVAGGVSRIELVEHEPGA